MNNINFRFILLLAAVITFAVMALNDAYGHLTQFQMIGIGGATGFGALLFDR